VLETKPCNPKTLISLETFTGVGEEGTANLEAFGQHSVGGCQNTRLFFGLPVINELLHLRSFIYQYTEDASRLLRPSA
jgi:hypothetical protein